MRFWLLLVLGCVAVSTAHAAPLRVAAGYYGDLISHPGGFAGLSWTVDETDLLAFSVGGELGGYHHERNHTALFLRGNLATRVKSSSGLYVEPRFHLGYMHTFVDGDEYWVVDSVTGQNRQVVNAGTPNVMLGMGLGIGVELDYGVGFVLRPEMSGRAPYNDFTLSQFALVVGVELALGRGGE